MKFVYAYIRVSTVKQGEKGCSLSEQRIAIEAYAKRHDLSVIEWFEEQETAAKRGRSIFARMLGSLIKGRASGVIFHKIDRGARNLRDWSDIGGLIDKGIEVHFAHESLDMQSRGGRLAADIQAVVAADFIRNLRDEVKKGFYGRLRQGIYPLRAPIGYLDQGRGLPKTPDPIMAPLVQHAFAAYATGRHNLHTIGEELYRLGLRNRYGNPVSRNGLSTLLNNEFYIGVMHIQKTGERFQGIHEPLVKKSVFDRVQNVLQGRTKNTGVKNDFRYRRSLRCRHCEYHLIAERQKGIVYYRCQTRNCPRACVREDAIDTQVQVVIQQLWMPPEEIRMLESEFQYLEQDRFQSREELIQGMELGIAELDARLERLTDALIDTHIDKQTFELRNKKLLHERAHALELLGKVREEVDAMNQRTKNFLEHIRAISRNADSPNGDEIRDLVKTATSNLHVAGKELVVTWINPFDVVADRSKCPYGELKRDTSRTQKDKPTDFAEELFKKIHE